MLIRRKLIDNRIEEKILIGLITNTNFCKDVLPILEVNSFEVPYINIVTQWCKEYFKKYNRAPERHIQDIFELEKNSIKEEEKNIIGELLSRLSTSFEDEKEFNVDYLKDKALFYLKKQSLKRLSSKIQDLLEKDKIEDAEKEVNKFKKVAKELSGSFDPFTKEEVDRFFDEINDKSNIVLDLPGALGRLIGSLERHWLVGILAPSKRGKTFWQQEFAVNGLMEKRKVFFVSLEMDKTRIKKRLYRRLTGYADRTDDYVYPCFDCLRNQNNTCKKKDRINQERLLKEDGSKPVFKKNMIYQPCVVCRGKKDYIVASWYTTIRREQMRRGNTYKIIQGVKQAFGDRLRIKCYPKFSANIHDIMDELYRLESVDNFIPDIIIIDYADILAPEDSRIVGRERIDETWKMMGRMADEHHCLVISASQSNRNSFKKQYVEEVDIAEDIRKIANSDLFIALNQTKEEKREGVMRINVIADRDNEFDSHTSCLCLQQLSIGQVCLDSEIILRREDDIDTILEEGT